MKSPLYYILLIVGFVLRAQNPQIDSLSSVLSSDTINSSDRIDVLTELSYAYHPVNPDTSIILGNKALKEAQKSGTALQKAWAMNRIAGAYWMKAKYPEVLNYAQKALNLFDSLGYKKGLADCLNVIANTHNMEGDHNLSLNYYLKTIDVFDEIGDTYSIARAYANIGRTHYMIKQYDSALYYLDLVLELQKNEEPNILIAIIQNTSGDVYQELNEFDKALEYYFMGLSIAEDLGVPRIITYSTRGISEIYQKQGQLNLSNQYAERTLSISKNIGYLENIKNASLILSDNYKSSGDYVKAFEYFQQHTSAKDSMYNLEKEREIKRLTESFEIEQKQKEIQLLTAEKELQLQENKNQRIILYALIIVVFLVILMAIIQYRKVVQRQRTNKLLTDQRNRLAQQNMDILKQQKEIESQSTLLEEANNTKDKLFSIMTHDLKSPFSSLLIVTEHLDNDTFTKEELSNLKVQLNAKVKSVLEMLNNLLFWAQSQIKGDSSNKTFIRLDQIINNNIELFNMVASGKNISLKAEKNAEIEVYGDKNQVDAIIRNLVNNAIKFTNKNGEVKIEVVDKDSFVEISVKDNGVGMDPEVIKSLFNPNIDTHTKGTADETGSGIGLFICKEFVEKNGGEIWVESKEGHGSTFHFTLPKKPN